MLFLLARLSDIFIAEFLYNSDTVLSLARRALVHEEKKTNGYTNLPTLASSELIPWSRVGGAIVTTLSYSLLVVFWYSQWGSNPQPLP